MTTPPYTTCLCSPADPCVACPLANPCSCGADAGQRCRRPSGHRGPFVMTHEDRMLRSDVDAIERDPADVETRLLSQREDLDAMRAWARALRSLTRSPHIWQGRIPATLLQRYLTLAEHPDRADAPEQLAMFP